MYGTRRIAASIGVVLFVGILVSVDGPALKPDHSNFEQFRFWLGMESAISYFIAVGIGAIVARKSIVIPALALAVIGWASIIHILFKIAVVAGPASYVEIAADNLLSLILWVIAAILGALTGRWFYEHEIKSGADVS